MCDRHDGQALSPYSRDDWILRECADCGFVYLQNPLPYTELSDNHAWTRTFVAERESRREREPVFHRVSQTYKAFRLRYIWRDKAPDRIRRFVGQGRLLDVGCGVGEVLRRLPESFTPYGIEIDAKAARIAHQYAKRHGGWVCHQDALSGLSGLEDRFFDGILMQSFLEHENQPRCVMQQAQRVLKPGGRIIIKVPNFASLNRRVRGSRWCGFRFPDHVNYFTPKTLLAMSHRANLEVVRFGLWDRAPTSDNMWMILQRPRHETGVRAHVRRDVA